MSDREEALAELIGELAGVVQAPQFVDPVRLDRLNSAFGRVRDVAPDVYRSDRSIPSLHFGVDYFASPDHVDVESLPLFLPDEKEVRGG